MCQFRDCLLQRWRYVSERVYANAQLLRWVAGPPTRFAAQAYSSRSGMTRRIDRRVDEGLVTRTSTDADGRGVVVGLTPAGLARFAEAAPVHLRGVSELFVDKLTDAELTTVARALDKVALDCTFG